MMIFSATPPKFAQISDDSESAFIVSNDSEISFAGPNWAPIGPGRIYANAAEVWHVRIHGRAVPASLAEALTFLWWEGFFLFSDITDRFLISNRMLGPSIRLDD